MNTARKGNSAEVFVAQHLQAQGWVVGSRRHMGDERTEEAEEADTGAGDLIAIHPNGSCWLIEVKCCRSLYQQFRREDRQRMKETKLPKGAVRWVVNKRGKDLEWVSELSWP